MHFRHTVPTAKRAFKSVRRSLNKIGRHDSDPAAPLETKHPTEAWWTELPHIVPGPELPEFSSFISSDEEQEHATRLSVQAVASEFTADNETSSTISPCVSATDGAEVESTNTSLDPSDSNEDVPPKDSSAQSSEVTTVDSCSHSDGVVSVMSAGAVQSHTRDGVTTRSATDSVFEVADATALSAVSTKESGDYASASSVLHRQVTFPLAESNSPLDQAAPGSSKFSITENGAEAINQLRANASLPCTVATTTTSSTSSSVGTFEDIISAIDYEKVCSIALGVRRKRQILPLSSKITCSVTDAPMMRGTYNMLQTIAFSDGVKYLVRTAANGLQMTGLDMVQMVNEYKTMQYIKSNYDIPVPVVYYWTMNKSEAGAPFALIEHLPGKPLNKVWPDLNGEMSEKVLTKIVIEMIQLAKVRYDNIGTLEFNAKGDKVRHVGPTVCTRFGTKPELQQHLLGPWHSLKAAHYDTMDLTTDQDVWHQCAMRIVHMAVQSIPEHMLPSGCTSLAFPDFNAQNILVDEDCNVTGLIDWGGVSTAPLSTGAASLPLFLMYDWDPWCRGSGAAFGEDDKNSVYYRDYYARCFAFFAKSQIKDYDPRMTKYSHLLWAIEEIKNRRTDRNMLVERLLDHAFAGERKFTMLQYCDAFLRRRVGQYDDQIIEAFANLWDADTEDAEAPEQDGVDDDSSSIRNASSLLHQIRQKVEDKIGSIRDSLSDVKRPVGKWCKAKQERLVGHKFHPSAGPVSKWLRKVYEGRKKEGTTRRKFHTRFSIRLSLAQMAEQQTHWLCRMKPIVV